MKAKESYSDAFITSMILMVFSQHDAFVFLGFITAVDEVTG